MILEVRETNFFTGTGIRPKKTVIRPNKSNIVNLILIFIYIPAGSFQIPHMILEVGETCVPC
jgi:hypothetical protein